MELDQYTASVKRDGYAIIPDALPRDEVDALSGAWQAFEDAIPAGGRRGGVRHLLAVWPPAIELARSFRIRRWVTPVLGDACFAVRGISFDKTPQANWKVSWHQDLAIAVRAAADIEGFGPWSIKDGVPHVQPPTAVLEGMLTVRVHLDDCGAENGPLRVLPGTHRLGRLSASDIDKLARSPCQACLVPRGGLVVMRPLLLHASSAATSPSRRRVIHLEFAAEALPGGLEWRERW